MSITTYLSKTSAITSEIIETETFIANGADLELLALRLPLFHLVEGHAQHVGVKTATQSLVGGDDDDSHLLHRIALNEERMTVLGIGMADVRRDVADFFRVRTRRAHAVLGLPHFRGRDHFHRLGDLARVLHALDLGAYFF